MANKSKEECDQIIESGVCHFTIGEDFGAMLMRIAQEKLEYETRRKELQEKSSQAAKILTVSSADN